MAVKTYSLKKNGSKSLSSHFKVREFRCKDGSDKVLIENGLIKYLEKVHKHFGCKSITITSGYRTPAHDRRVGGKGKGAHTKGKAADFKCLGPKGSYISSKEIALYLEDIGVKGIGYRCGGSDTATHMDINYRTFKWYGDEKYSMSASIGKSFYNYLKVKYTTKKAISNINLRVEPGTHEKIAMTIKKGTKVNVADTDKIIRDKLNWVRVKYNGKHYWAVEKYLK